MLICKNTVRDIHRTFGNPDLVGTLPFEVNGEMYISFTIIFYIHCITFDNIVVVTDILQCVWA